MINIQHSDRMAHRSILAYKYFGDEYAFILHKGFYKWQKNRVNFILNKHFKRHFFALEGLFYIYKEVFKVYL